MYNVRYPLSAFKKGCWGYIYTSMIEKDFLL